MTSGNSRVRALVLAVGLLLPGLPLRALPLAGPRDDRGALAVLFDGVWSFWRGLIDSRGTGGVAMKEGMTIDPHGSTTNLGANPDEGTSIDPHGTAGAMTKEGMSIDPSGRLGGAGTNAGATTDNGMLIDPHG
jgi:hypothetical protein